MLVRTFYKLPLLDYFVSLNVRAFLRHGSIYPPNWLLDVRSACVCGCQPKYIMVLLPFCLSTIAFEQGLQYGL
jgi:hypothetical protein